VEVDFYGKNEMPMRKKIINIMNIIIASMFLFSISCTKKYNFEVRNETKYTLNEVSFDWCNGNNKISVNPYSSVTVSLSYKVRFLNIFASGSLCVIVLTYSDTQNVYKNTIGAAIDRSILKKHNVIKITEKSASNNSNIFSITLEN
jgi:hypothetical protein